MVERPAAAGSSPPVTGLVVVDKEPGWTSHDVVARCRTIFGQRRTGHAGTLDPGATGVLVVALGRATRLLRFVSGLSKAYVGEVVLGRATSTLDADGETVGVWDMSGIGMAEARVAAAGLTGEVLQVPPMVSALKVGGRRLHELARAGIEVDRPPRRVRVSRFDVEETPTPGVLEITVECSSGTYVRSLAGELGERLGGGAHLRNLRRVAVGPFSVEEATVVGRLSSASVLPPSEALRGRPCLQLGPELAAAVGHGRPLDRSEADPPGEGPWPVLDRSGCLLGVYEDGGDGLLRPAVVLAPVAPR